MVPFGSNIVGKDMYKRASRNDQLSGSSTREDYGNVVARFGGCCARSSKGSGMDFAARILQRRHSGNSQSDLFDESRTGIERVMSSLMYN